MLELQQHRWDEHEKSVAGLNDWLTEQQKRLDEPPLLNSAVSVQHRQKEMGTLNEQLKDKQQDIKDLETDVAQLLKVDNIPDRSPIGMQIKVGEIDMNMFLTLF